jgi:hypothetical protein
VATSLVEELRGRKLVQAAGLFAAPAPAVRRAILRAGNGCDTDPLRIHRTQSGVGSLDAWQYPGGDGDWTEKGRRRAVRVVVIDRGYLKSTYFREPWRISLCPSSFGMIAVPDCYAPAYLLDHGTMTLGVLFADHDSDPVIQGICPGAEPFFVQTEHTRHHISESIDAASVQLGWFQGDVLLIEQEVEAIYEQPVDGGTQQVIAQCPVEIDPPIRDAIHALVSCLGVTVVLPAGNSGGDLAKFSDEGEQKRIWDRDPQNPHEVDTGSVIVGAGYPPFWRNRFHRMQSSNHGRRVNCQGWGDCVRTTLKLYGYKDDFGETSAAAAMIAGVAASIQGACRARYGQALPPDQLRAYLECPDFAVQASRFNEEIGPLPDLSRILRSLIPPQFEIPFVAPDLPQPPYEISWEMLCPDIVVGPEPLPPGPLAAEQRGEPHLSGPPRADGPGTIQLVVRNPRPGKAALDAVAYAFEPNCFPHPRSESWSEVARWTVDVEGDEAQLTEAKTIELGRLPQGLVRSCGFAVLQGGAGRALESVGDLTGLSTDGFRQALREGRVAVRGAAVHEPAPDDRELLLFLWIGGIAEHRESHKLSFDFRVPETMLPDLEWDAAAEFRATAPKLDVTRPLELELEPDDRHLLRIVVPLPEKPEGERCEIRLRQFAGGRYLGAFSHLIRLPRRMESES